MKERKRTLREEVKASRRSMTPTERTVENDSIARLVLGLPELRAAGNVLVYAAMPDEPQTASIATALEERGVTVAYPRVAGEGCLTLHVTAALAPGFRGILEPVEGAPAIPADRIDAVLVPACAYDRSCRRLGMGGGFYDRLLEALRPDAIRIGLAFRVQMLDEVPVEPHDAGVDLVVTPDGVIRA